MTDYALARHNMIECQIRTNKVTDPGVIRAMETIPRELFVPANRRSLAYVDEDLPLGDGRWLMEPMVFARLLQSAAISESDVVLDVGCGTGYSTAVLARLASTVVALESGEALVASATATLRDAAVDNAVVLQADLKMGYPEQAPYDVIVIEGAVPEVPEQLEAQIAEGGRLVCVLTQPGSVGRAMLFAKHGGVMSQRVLFDASIGALAGFEAEQAFVF